jgi:hypothetical protein
MGKCIAVNPVSSGQRIAGYHCLLPNKQTLFVLGDYTNACGGADGIQPYSAIWPRVADAAAVFDHVMFEGALISTTYGSIGQAADAYGADFVFAFLDTPLDVCVARVNQRRAAAGKPPLRDTKSIDSKWVTISRLYDKLSAGAIVTANRNVTISYLTPAKDLLKLLGIRANKEPTYEAA